MVEVDHCEGTQVPHVCAVTTKGFHTRHVAHNVIIISQLLLLLYYFMKEVTPSAKAGINGEPLIKSVMNTL